MRLLGMDVYYLFSAKYHAAKIIDINNNGTADLRIYMFPGIDKGEGMITIRYGVERGDQVGQWQDPDMIPHDDLGRPMTQEQLEEKEKVNNDA